MRYRLVAPTNGKSQAVDTFNGNVALVARAVYDELGEIDGAFSHAQADFDYGLRAKKAGIAVVVSGRPVGICPYHSPQGSWRDVALPATERLRLAIGRKGIPPRSTARFLRRHGGRYWIVLWAATYAKLAASLVVGHRSRYAADGSDRSNSTTGIAGGNDTGRN